MIVVMLHTIMAQLVSKTSCILINASKDGWVPILIKHKPIPNV